MYARVDRSHRPISERPPQRGLSSSNVRFGGKAGIRWSFNELSYGMIDCREPVGGDETA